MQRQRTLAAPLALVYIGLILYASLYPFSGWRWNSGLDAPQLLQPPWPRYFIPFDLVSNLLGYLPLGALMYLTLVRSGARGAVALALAPAWCSALSYSMEVAQNFNPPRVPSSLDWLLNSLGATLGVLLVAMMHRQGAVAHWEVARERWCIKQSTGSLALLLLWPAGLLFPTAVPFGLGQVAGHLRELIRSILEDTPWAEWTNEWTSSAGLFESPHLSGAEGGAAMLGLLAPCLLAFSVMHSWLKRLVATVCLVLAGLATMTLSTALNFGPQHAFAWVSAVSMPAIAAAMATAAVLAFLPRRIATGFALVCVIALVAVVAQAPSDPYYALSLQGWEQGRFIRFHGLAKWIGWLWPYAVLSILVLRLWAGDPEEPAA